MGPRCVVMNICAVTCGIEEVTTYVGVFLGREGVGEAGMGVCSWTACLGL